MGKKFTWLLFCLCKLITFSDGVHFNFHSKKNHVKICDFRWNHLNFFLSFYFFGGNGKSIKTKSSMKPYSMPHLSFKLFEFKKKNGKMFFPMREKIKRERRMEIWYLFPKVKLKQRKRTFHMVNIVIFFRMRMFLRKCKETEPKKCSWDGRVQAVVKNFIVYYQLTNCARTMKLLIRRDEGDLASSSLSFFFWTYGATIFTNYPPHLSKKIKLLLISLAHHHWYAFVQQWTFITRRNATKIIFPFL